MNNLVTEKKRLLKQREKALNDQNLSKALRLDKKLRKLKVDN